MSGYRPGQRYIGRDGDILFVIIEPGPEHTIAFVTSMGTRVSLGEAARVYAPLTLTPEVEDVAELAAAIRDALDLPDHAPGSTEAYTAHRELLATRAYYVRGALASVADRESHARHAIASLRRADEWYPATYPTADSTGDEPDGDDWEDPGNGADFFACDHKTTDEPGHDPAVCRRLTDAEMDALTHGSAGRDMGVPSVYEDLGVRDAIRAEVARQDGGER